MAVWLHAKVRKCGLGLRPRPNTGPVCDAHGQRGSICWLEALYKCRTFTFTTAKTGSGTRRVKIR